MLKHRQITVLDPATWDDTNDSYYLLKYKEKKSQDRLGALPHKGRGNYHHWKIFSHGSAGVCINFHLTQALRS
jgi:hypothetical protein